MTKHTPTPWFRLEGDVQSPVYSTTRDMFGMPTRVMFADDDSIAPEDMAFLLRAVNAHAALVEALELAIPLLEENGYLPEVSRLQQALKLAKG